MKKIISGILGIVLVASVVSATAYALFSSNATITGVTVTAGNANLMVGNATPEHAKTITSATPIANLYPGIYITKDVPGNDPINLYNTSTSPISLKVKSQITSWQSNGGDWNALADSLQIRVINVTNPGSPVNGAWHTLREWHDVGYDLPGDPLPQATATPYSGKGSFEMEFYIDASVGNEIANADLSNMTITMTGTQVN